MIHQHTLPFRTLLSTSNNNNNCQSIAIVWISQFITEHIHRNNNSLTAGFGNEISTSLPQFRIEWWEQILLQCGTASIIRLRLVFISVQTCVVAGCANLLSLLYGCSCYCCRGLPRGLEYNQIQVTVRRFDILCVGTSPMPISYAHLYWVQWIGKHLFRPWDWQTW